MFRRLSEPLPLSEASLLVLRPALNAPVLNVEYLPVGPARAALVAFAEEYGGIGLAFGLRSVHGGQVVVFRNQGSIDESASLAKVLEPALAAGERMGFLFDEDVLSASTGRGRAEAFALWSALMGDVDATSVEVPVPSGEVGDVGEVLLDEIALDVEAGEPSASGPESTAPTMPMEPPRPVLSKFRQARPGQAAAGRSAPVPGSALGRIPLKRVRRGGAQRIPGLARLLASF